MKRDLRREIDMRRETEMRRYRDTDEEKEMGRER